MGAVSWLVSIWGADFTLESTLSMAKRLSQMAGRADPLANPFMNDERIPIFRKQFEDAQAHPETFSASVLDYQVDYAAELLFAGRNLDAIDHLRDALARSKGGGLYHGRRFDPAIANYLALAYLRLGEQENCLSNHNALSCIVPIAPGAAHKFPRGSRQAAEILLQRLKEAPEDLQAQWLLNIAFMTLGEYPQGVPSKLLIPPKSFESDYDIGRFPEIASNLGLDVAEHAGGSITEDFDGDGFLDIAVSSMGLRDQLRLFHNNGDGTFTERTREAGLTGEVGGLNIMQTDFDNDGRPDIFVLRGGWFGRGGKYPKSLLRNRGDGTFEDVTERAGLLSMHPSQTATWFDFDGDGWLDVFIGHETRDATDPNRCELYRNNHDGTFTECAETCGVAVLGWVKGVASGDFNNDGRPDLYISRLGEPNLLFRNDGPRQGSTNGWTFTDVTKPAGVAEPLFSFPTWFFDYDNDGWEDLFVSGYRAKNVGDIAADYLGRANDAEKPRLYRNNHDGTFSDVTQRTHLNKALLAMGANFGDLDNDGWPDFYLGTGEPDLAALVPNRMFRNVEGKFFQDVTTSGGFGHLQKGHGISFADLDNDGDQDIYEVLGGAFSGDTYRNVLFQNPGHGNNWIKLILEGVRANRAAIGARIKVVAAGAGGERVIHRTVGSGGSFGASPLRQEIGIGPANSIQTIEIRWPGSGTVQVLTNPPVRSLLKVREGAPAYQVVPLRSFQFENVARAEHHHH